MNKALAIVLGIAATVIVGVDAAGLSGAFPENKFDAGATSIPTTAPTTATPQPHHPATPNTSTAAPPSRSACHCTPPLFSTSAPISSSAPPSSIFSIPPATPVPAGAISTSPIGNGTDVTTIGDSIMVDAQPYLVQLLPGIVVDGKVSRQLIQTPPVVSALQSAAELHRYVVIELGTNGPFTASQLASLMKQMGPHHAFVLVNTSDPRPWEHAANQVIDSVASTYPHTVLVNWYQAAQSIPQDFYPDDVHLKPTGALYIATLIAEAVVKLQREYPPRSA